MSILEQTFNKHNSNTLSTVDGVTSLAVVDYFNQADSSKNSAPTDPAWNPFVHNCATEVETPVDLKFRRLYQSQKWLAFADRYRPEKEKKFKQTCSAFKNRINASSDVIGVQEVDEQGEISHSLRNLQTTKFRGDPIGAERRALDDYKVIRAIEEKMSVRGGHVIMLTLTSYHQKGDKLEQIHETFKTAWRNLRKSGTLRRTYETILEDLGYLGGFKIFADTIGSNGFHHHLHVGLCVDILPDDDQIFALKELWRASIKKAGSWASLEYGLEVSFPPDVAGYIRKQSGWGLAEEFTMDRFKSGQSIHPLQLLDMPESEQARDLYVEWAETISGQRIFQLLNNILDELELDKDTILAEEDIQKETIVCVLPPSLWVYVRRLNIIAELLTAIAEGDDEVWSLLHIFGNSSKVVNRDDYYLQIQKAKETTIRARRDGLTPEPPHNPPDTHGEDVTHRTFYEDPETGKVLWFDHD